MHAQRRKGPFRLHTPDGSRLPETKQSRGLCQDRHQLPPASAGFAFAQRPLISVSSSPIYCVEGLVSAGSDAAGHASRRRW